ncbi:MAG: class I SAM-dependent RNA methyltransferase [Nitrospiraceae bacterium]|nr:MAG: class I SAM-dependent RNA methyltransferase [Nitrospiraceae bacterium]
MYDYQKDKLFFAQIADGLKELGDRELSSLGARNTSQAYGGIYFSAGMEELYRINYSARLSTRILAPLVTFDCTSADQLYEKAVRTNWTDFISTENTFAVFSNVSNSTITNSHYASLRLKDGIVDAFREMTGKRPDIDPVNPDLWINLHIRDDRAVIGLDTSGGSLHRRGYRKDAVSAPMQETTAAAIIRHTEWSGRVPFYDPMCGSGTLLCEALMHYCRVPSGFLREHFGFEFLPDYDEQLWTKVKEEIDNRVRALPAGLISGSDSSGEAVGISKANLSSLPYGDKVNLEVLDFRKHRGLENGTIVVNPPYGIRMGKRQGLELLYKSLGDFLKQRCRGSAAYIYFGDRRFISNIGLKPAWKKPLKTGGLDGRLVKYELF